MNAERTFTSRLQQLIKRGYDPTYVLLLLEHNETLLLDYLALVMADKNKTDEDKGRLAMAVTELLNGNRKAKAMVPSIKISTEKEQPHQLTNSHLQ